MENFQSYGVRVREYEVQAPSLQRTYHSAEYSHFVDDSCVDLRVFPWIIELHEIRLGLLIGDWLFQALFRYFKNSSPELSVPKALFLH